MKNTGLSNRFSQETRAEWIYWYDCMICGMNGIDALHHIMSPSNRNYVKGDHNKSVLNSCPIHNQKCHIGKEGYLNKDTTVKLLLNRTLKALSEMGYKLNDRDWEYSRVYLHLYTSNDLKMLK